MTLFNKTCFFGIIVTIMFSTSVSAQENLEKYTVGKGETVTQIARKFNITPYDIYKLNPDAQNGLKPDSVLLIPKSKGKNTSDVKKSKQQTITHQVLAKETLFGIEKKYDVTEADLKKANPDLEKNGLQIGQILNIPSKSNSKPNTAKNSTVIYHTVLPKETKYSIAKQYGITIEELEHKNPEIIPNLTIGYELLIKGSRPKKVMENPVSENQAVTKNPNAVNTPEAVKYAEYTIKSKETLYSLSKQFNLTQQQLIELNSNLSSGVQEGMVIRIPSESNQIFSNPLRQKVTLTNIKNNEKKTLVLLLPFNVDKNGGDISTLNENTLNNDKFLNMTLDFYSGAMMAIDSAKQMGVNMDVKIFDSGETKTTSNVTTIFNNDKMVNADAVIGPFYQNNVEKTASVLVQNNVPVISPLSKDEANSTANLYQSVISNTLLKTAMFDYLNSKQGNIIAVIDKKRETSKKYILENQKAVKIAPLTETGGFNSEGFKSLLVKDRMNYVILETGSTGMIKYTIKAMLSAMPAYQVQLVILEPNETLDSDDIYFENLTKLHLMYPSATRENISSGAQIFMQNYRKKNKVNPSTYAIRGFDVTFDTMMRLAQDKTYQETAETMITEQIESKFEYQKNVGGGYSNKGLYILYYDTDLTIKEAN